MYFPANKLLYELTFRNFQDLKSFYNFTYIEVTVTTEEFTLQYNLTWKSQNKSDEDFVTH